MPNGAGRAVVDAGAVDIPPDGLAQIVAPGVVLVTAEEDDFAGVEERGVNRKLLRVDADGVPAHHDLPLQGDH